MSELAEGIGLIAGLIGLLTLVATGYVWHQVPKETVKQLREELKEQRQRIADRDKELADFRRLRQGDLRRLETDEAHGRRLEAEVTEHRAWRYGAERYMRAMESWRSGQPKPNRDDYGINGETPLPEEEVDEH